MTIILTFITAGSAAAAAAQDQPAGIGMGGILIQFAAIFALFYFLFIRPQQKQRRAHEDRIRQVRKGDEIVTAGGIVGEVVHIKEGLKDGSPTPTMEDRITIKSGESRLVIERGRISRVAAAVQGEEKAK